MLRADDEIADVGVGLEQHRRRKQHVVDADDALLVELDVVEERRAAVEREVQRVVQVVIEVRAGADQEVDEAAVHELDDAAAEAGGRQAPATVSPMVVSLAGSSILSVKMWQASDSRPALKAWNPLSMSCRIRRCRAAGSTGWLFPKGSSSSGGPETPAIGGAYAIEHSTGDLQKLCRSAEKP